MGTCIQEGQAPLSCVTQHKVDSRAPPPACCPRGPGAKETSATVTGAGPRGQAVRAGRRPKAADLQGGSAPSRAGPETPRRLLGPTTREGPDSPGPGTSHAGRERAARPHKGRCRGRRGPCRSGRKSAARADGVTARPTAQARACARPADGGHCPGPCRATQVLGALCLCPDLVCSPQRSALGRRSHRRPPSPTTAFPRCALPRALLTPQPESPHLPPRAAFCSKVPSLGYGKGDRVTGWDQEVHQPLHCLPRPVLPAWPAPAQPPVSRLELKQLEEARQLLQHPAGHLRSYVICLTSRWRGDRSHRRLTHPLAVLRAGCWLVLQRELLAGTALHVLSLWLLAPSRSVVADLASQDERERLGHPAVGPGLRNHSVTSAASESLSQPTFKERGLDVTSWGAACQRTC
ncbi:uncharacterized protein LOC130858403 [Hippopotamus amphibius kiboko]|uniref:uncharacterized protein LOC130858403 n=1 Tax=Hippopotamus amphibius kiboko TaxID=575201 RepID=UPI0025933143|nr:uncharacterized protein LOC130858403 [Hippopotamus amphibius kiboko]